MNDDGSMWVVSVYTSEYCLGYKERKRLLDWHMRHNVNKLFWKRLQQKLWVRYGLLATGKGLYKMFVCAQAPP